MSPSQPPICGIYARVSTQDQKCDLQLTDLRAYASRCGWQVVEYIETASGKAGSRRPVLQKLLQDARLRKINVVAVWKMDRFGRSLQHLIENIQVLDQAGVRFVAPNQSIDTDNKSPMGKLIMHLMGAFAEFERGLIVERVLSGMAEAKRQGKHLGRPVSVWSRGDAEKLLAEGLSLREVGAKLGVSASSVCRAMRKLCQKA